MLLSLMSLNAIKGGHLGTGGITVPSFCPIPPWQLVLLPRRRRTLTGRTPVERVWGQTDQTWDPPFDTGSQLPSE